MTIPMSHTFMADTWGTRIAATTGVLTQTCPSIGRTTYFCLDMGVVEGYLNISSISYLTSPMN